MFGKTSEAIRFLSYSIMYSVSQTLTSPWWLATKTTMTATKDSSAGQKIYFNVLTSLLLCNPNRPIRFRYNPDFFFLYNLHTELGWSS